MVLLDANGIAARQQIDIFVICMLPLLISCLMRVGAAGHRGALSHWTAQLVSQCPFI